MGLPKELTKVTRLSRVLALLLFMALPVVGFFVGISYQSKKDISTTIPEVTQTPTPNIEDDIVLCTQDAKLCPDGSYVGRSGPNCEFATCPSPQ